MSTAAQDQHEQEAGREPGAEPSEFEFPQASPPDAGGSVLEGLIERREEIARDTETVLPVEVFEGKLAVHYQLLEWKRTNEFAQRLQKAQGRDPLADLNASASLIAEAALGVLVPDPEQQGTPPEDAGPTWGWRSVDPRGEVRRFDSVLLGLFRIDVPPGKIKQRDVVRLVFNRDHAVTAHAQELLLWMQGANGEVSRDYAAG